MERYLNLSKIIDFENPLVSFQGAHLAKGSEDPVETASSCFYYVRDSILHSYDYCQNPVTVKASDVLYHKTGFCMAKSHLLAALLRTNNIPTEFCYQRLLIGDPNLQQKYCFHVFVALYLPTYGWYRLDPKGNNESVNTEFTPPVEYSAYTAEDNGELVFPEIWPEPLPVIIESLMKAKTYTEFHRNIPDIEIITDSQIIKKSK